MFLNNNNYIKSYVTAPLLLSINSLDVLFDTLLSTQNSNIILPLIFLWVFFGLFMLFNVFFSFAALLLITEAAMLTLILMLTVAVTAYFPNLTADILNLLNASAMEAIIGITIVFVHQKSWKNRYTNSNDVVLESMSLFSFYLLLVFTGYVGWHFFYLVFGVTYYWIKSVFKTSVVQIRQIYINWIKIEKILINLFKSCKSNIYNLWNSCLEAYNNKCKMEQIRIETGQKSHLHIKKSLFFGKNLNFNKQKKIYKYKIQKIHTIKKIIKYKKMNSQKVNWELTPKNPSKFNLKLFLNFIIIIMLGLVLFNLNELDLNNITELSTTPWQTPVNLIQIYPNKIDMVVVKTYLDEKNKFLIDLGLAVKKNEKLYPIEDSVSKFINLTNNAVSVVASRWQNLSIQNYTDLVGINPRGVLYDLNELLENSVYGGSYNLNYSQHIDKLENYTPILTENIQKSIISDHQLRVTLPMLDNGFVYNLKNKAYLTQYFQNSLNIGFDNKKTKVDLEGDILNVLNNLTQKLLNRGDSLKIQTDLIPTSYALSNGGGNKRASEVLIINKTKRLGTSNDSIFFYKKNKFKILNTNLVNLKNFENRNTEVYFFLKKLNNNRRIFEDFFKPDTYKLKNLKQLWHRVPSSTTSFSNAMFMFFDINKLGALGVRPLHLNLNFRNNINFLNLPETNMGIEYKKQKETIYWSGKNWDSIFTYYSKLLPWFESADMEEDALLDYKEIGDLNSVRLLSENLRLGVSGTWDQPEIIDSRTLLPADADWASNNSSDNLVVKNLRLSTHLIKILERGLKNLEIKLEGLDTTQKLLITRKPLNFPVSSPRTMNHYLSDTVFNSAGAAYSRGSARSPQELFDKIEKPINGLGFTVLNKNIYEWAGGTRLFSYSSLTDDSSKFRKIIEFSGENNKQSSIVKALKKKTIKNIDDVDFWQIANIKNELDYGDDSEYDLGETDDLIDYRLRVLNSRPKKNKLKMFIDGNTKKYKIQHKNRAQDITDNRKKVIDRMILPIQNILVEREKYPQNWAFHGFKVLPKNQITNFIDKNERLREIPNIWWKYRELPLKNYDSVVGLDTNLTNNGLMTFEDDLEINLENLRTSDIKPHSLYGLLWDEYLKQTYSLSLEFLNFNDKFKDIFKNNNEIINFNYKENLERALSPDFRYNFTINDEIKNTILGRMLPKVGYFSEILTPNDLILNLTHKRKKWVLRGLREQFYAGRGYKKKLKKYLKRQLKYAERPMGFKYDQLPHQIKLPYRKKVFWANNSQFKSFFNFGYETFGGLQKKNQYELQFSRQRLTLPLKARYAKLPKYIKYQHRDLIRTFRGFVGEKAMGHSESIKNYKYDKFRNGVEMFESLNKQSRDDSIKVHRLATLKNKSFTDSGAYYIFKNTKSGIWKNNNNKLKRKQNMRNFMQNTIGADSILFTRGTDKYQNDEYFDKIIEKYRITKLRENREYWELDDYMNPITSLIRSGDLFLESNLQNLENLKLLRYRKIIKGAVAADKKLNFLQLTPLKDNSLSKSFFKNSLLNPSFTLENEAYNPEFYSEFLSQNKYFMNEISYLDYPTENIILDGWDFFQRNSLGEPLDVKKNTITVANLEENQAINTELRFKLNTGNSNPTRNYYTYFSLNSWGFLGFSGCEFERSVTNLDKEFKIKKKIIKKSNIFLKILLNGLFYDYILLLNNWSWFLVDKLNSYFLNPKFENIFSNIKLLEYKNVSILFNLKLKTIFIWIILNILKILN